MKKYYSLLSILLFSANLWSQTSTIIYTATGQLNIKAANFDAKYDADASSYNAETGRGTLVFNGVLTSINGDAFLNCSSLTSIFIPKGVTTIGETSFSGCYSLTSITIPNTLTSVGNAAFFKCSNLTELTFLGTVAELRDKRIIHLFGNPSVIHCSDGDFRNVDFKSTYADGTVKYESTISNPSELVSVEIQPLVTDIRNSALSGCTQLTSIYVPEGITSIGRYAFSDCSNLVEIVFPSTLTSIEAYALGGCSKLKKIRIKATTPPLTAIYLYSGTPSAMVLYVPCGCVGVYKDHGTWNEEDYVSDVVEYTPHVIFVAIDDTMGSVAVIQQPNCSNDFKTIACAIPADGYKFVKWNDGSAENLRNITISEDSTLTATFAPEDIFHQPTEPGMRMKVTTKTSKVYEFDTKSIGSIDYYQVTE